MKTKPIYLLVLSVLLSVIFSGCNEKKEVAKESWMAKPVKDWPAFALTNDIAFTDTTFHGIANAFLVDTGKDTLAVSCKHLFMVFEINQGLSSIDLGPQFVSWKMYRKNRPEQQVEIKKLINQSSNEPIGQFNTLKDRDWILFSLQEKNKNIYPLKIRYTPVRPNEVVFAVGWGALQKDNRYPKLIKMQCFKNMGNYFYVQTLTRNVRGEGRSGSPVIDRNGYLVGLISGQEGKLGVIGSVAYLQQLFDKYGISYQAQ
ncbi:trypsin-like serine protease [Prolixibacter denitrificans]|uniref:Trypsin n=1 Tax=Prolixibacter denitrificans TaxID=1541063 RepID=A0A2P8CFJ0_9BACT|nr:trypsin-like serine protease [Prolixibacter denitrificans]PSK83692.1 trypsin [Prolixibacter denitrificans]GET23237.1 hypothetical protein JCM18694_34830 [Prolixibacter denitrificans]